MKIVANLERGVVVHYLLIGKLVIHIERFLTMWGVIGFCFLAWRMIVRVF